MSVIRFVADGTIVFKRDGNVMKVKVISCHSLREEQTKLPLLEWQ
jgi:hypothetical protein